MSLAYGSPGIIISLEGRINLNKIVSCIHKGIAENSKCSTASTLSTSESHGIITP